MKCVRDEKSFNQPDPRTYEDEIENQMVSPDPIAGTTVVDEEIEDEFVADHEHLNRENDPDYIKSEAESSSDSEREDEECLDPGIASDDDNEDMEIDRKSLMKKSETLPKSLKQESFKNSSPKRKTNDERCSWLDPNTGRRMWSCLIDGCEKIFGCKSLLNEHKKVEHEKGIHLLPITTKTCTICNKTYTSAEGLRSHIKFKHSGAPKKSFPCLTDGCEEIFLAKHLLIIHQSERHGIGGDLSVNCDPCGKRFRSEYYLARHKKQVHDGGYLKKKEKLGKIRIPEQVCDLCHVSFPRSEIYEHIRAHVCEDYVMKCPNPECQIVHSNPMTLRRHLRMGRCLNKIPNGKQYLEQSICEVCGYSAKKQGEIKIHLLDCHENALKRFACPIEGCQEKFTMKQSVSFHIHQHDLQHAKHIQKCTECNIVVKVEEMSTHLKEKHEVEENGVIACKQCSFLFPSREHHLLHLFVHRHDVLFCDICVDGVAFSGHADLLKHSYTVHQIGSPFSCEYCGRFYMKKQQLSRHLQIAHPLESGLPLLQKHKLKFNCETCKSEFNGKEALKYHKIKIHGEEPLGCSFCKETFTTRNKLLRHERTHKGWIPEEFQCTVEGCGKIFSKRCELKMHNSRIHLRLKPYICDVCGKARNTKTELKRHKDIVRLGLRPYVCETCGESFKCGSVLVDLCGQRFRHNNVLKTHVKSHIEKGANFKPIGAMKHIRKRSERKT